jgi:hypothetical protein
MYSDNILNISPFTVWRQTFNLFQAFKMSFRALSSYPLSRMCFKVSSYILNSTNSAVETKFSRNSAICIFIHSFVRICLSIFRNWFKQLIKYCYFKVNHIWNSKGSPNSSTIPLSNSLLFECYFFTEKHVGVMWNRIKFKSLTASFQCIWNIRNWSLAFI